MSLALTAADVAALSDAQKDAVLACLFVALIADGQPTSEERTKYDDLIAALPWGRFPQDLELANNAISLHLTTATREQKLAFVTEMAANVPTAVRENVVKAMASIVAADRSVTAGEKASLSAFIHVFGLTPEQIENIRRHVSEQ